jgi:hypothetical protein
MRRELQARISRFFAAPATDEWLAVLRSGLGLQVVLYCVSLRNSWGQLFAPTGAGLLSRQLAEAIASTESSLIPRLGWAVKGMSHLGISDSTALLVTWCVLLIAGVLLTLGLYTRAAAIVAWLLHVAAATSGGLLSYGVDNFMTIGLFYIALGPLPDRYALDARFRGHAAPDALRLGFWRECCNCTSASPTSSAASRRHSAAAGGTGRTCGEP